MVLYAYTRLGLGELPGFLVAWGYWISIWCTNAAIAVALVGYLEVFFPVLGENKFAAITTGLGVIWFFTWINSKALKTIALVQVLTTILKIVPITLVGLLAIFTSIQIIFFQLTISGSSSFSAITITTTLTLFAFLGMESATIASKHIVNADTTIKKATMAGTLITIVVYIMSSIAIMGIIPPDVLSQSKRAICRCCWFVLGRFGKVHCCSRCRYCNSWSTKWVDTYPRTNTNGCSSRYLFPKIFGKTNTHGAPISGIILSSILASILMGLNYTKGLIEAFTFMMKLSTLSVLTPYLLSTISFLILERKKEGAISLSKKLLSYTTLLFCVWVIIGCGIETISWGVVLLAIGVPFYIKIKKTI